MSEVEAILEFWFDDCRTSPEKAEARKRFWFAPDSDVDGQVSTRFGDWVVRAADGEFSHWKHEPLGCLALVIALDQFPRNIHRGTADAFRHDDRALEVARVSVESDLCDRLDVVESAFLLMPYQHAEDLVLQQRGVALMQRLADRAAVSWRPVALGFADYARQHMEIIDRFGRFPHRNALLGRESSPAERAFIESGGQTFGQSTTVPALSEKGTRSNP